MDAKSFFSKFTTLPQKSSGARPAPLDVLQCRLSENIITDSATWAIAFYREQSKRAEKQRWKATADAKAAKLKEQGNAAFQQGDFETAYIIYSACVFLSITNPVYSLNRAAVALKLKLYDIAVGDARMTIEKAEAGYGDGVQGFNLAKAYFRRGKARFHLGHWDEAAEDYDAALALQPGDAEIMRGIEELNKVRRTTCSCADKHHHANWISEQGKVNASNLFPKKEFDRRVESWMSGTTIEECVRWYD
ncbi:hypothetical protein B0H19DRAFT_1246169 [Mycena capillaripes]|nr:hypothetical protein B0H19DRAFT_1246169 [Mycena capillaripes]